MAVLVTFVTPDHHGQLQRERRSVEGAVLRLGRSTDCEVHLPDARVALLHAHIAIGETGATLDADGGALEVNGHRIRSAQLKPGDRIDIGPYAIEVEAPRPGVPLALTVRASEPAGARSWRRPFSSLPVSKRRLSYLAAGAIVLLFLALPILGHRMDEASGKDGATGQSGSVATHLVSAVGAKLTQAWNPGPVSRGHEAFGEDCGACHGFPMVQVRDAACIACHKTIEQHVSLAQLTGPLAPVMHERRCAQCHLDHKGQQLAPRAQELCVDCHRDVKAVAPDAHSGNVTDFGADHPRFRLSLVDARTDDAVHRIRQGEAMAERSNLKFNHALHLDPAGVRDPKGKRDAAGMRNARGGRTVLKCADCHEPAGDGIAPLSMDRHCRSCHSLAFEPKRSARQVPHGSPEMATMLSEFYALQALRDAPPAPGDAAGPPRARPGTELTYQERQRVLQIADRNAKQALRELYETRDVCSTCHYITRQTAQPGWKIAPVRVSSAWMPNSSFSHAKHRTEPCTACHAVTQSKDAKDVAMPDLANCRRCHVGARPVRNKVASDCALCHRFHAAGEPWDPALQPAPMHKAGARPSTLAAAR